jgi:hypothetical protein
MALPDYRNQRQVRQDHPNWNDRRVDRVLERNQQTTPPAPSTYVPREYIPGNTGYNTPPIAGPPADYGPQTGTQPTQPQATGYTPPPYTWTNPWAGRSGNMDRWNQPATAPPTAVPTDYSTGGITNGYAGPQTPPSNSGQHPFFDPNAAYTKPGDPFYQFPEDSQPYNLYATNEAPEGWYYAHLNNQGLGGLDARSQAAQGMYRDFALAYQAAKATGNLELWWPQFMKQQNIQGLIEGMSHDQLGIDEGAYRGRGERWALRGM